MPISTITRAEAASIQSRIQSALEAEFKKDGLIISIDGGTFAPTLFKPKLTVTVRDSSGNDAAEKAKWNMYCKHYGLVPSDFGCTVFNSRGEECILNGINPRRSRFPILGTRVRDGKHFKFTIDIVNRVLPAKPASANKATKPSKMAKVVMCKYCGKRPQVEHNHGACGNGHCVIQAMRDI